MDSETTTPPQALQVDNVPLPDNNSTPWYEKRVIKTINLEPCTGANYDDMSPRPMRIPAVDQTYYARPINDRGFELVYLDQTTSRPASKEYSDYYLGFESPEIENVAATLESSRRMDLRASFEQVRKELADRKLLGHSHTMSGDIDASYNKMVRGLINTMVFGLYPEKGGTLWIGNFDNTGMNMTAGDFFATYGVASFFNPDTVQTIRVNQDGKSWYSVAPGSLYHVVPTEDMKRPLASAFRRKSALHNASLPPLQDKIFSVEEI